MAATWQKSLEYLAYQWYLAIGGTPGTAGETTWAKSLNYWLWQIAVLYGETATHWNMPVEYWLYRIYVLNGGTAVTWQKPAEYWARLIYGQVTATTPTANFSLEYWLYEISQNATPPFDPAAISTYWFKADGLVGLNDGDPIVTMLDFSGNDNHALQAAGASRASYRVNVQNGLPVARFVANDFYATLPFAIPLAQPNLVFLVARTTTIGGDTFYFDGITAGDRHALFNSSGGGGTWAAYAGASLVGPAGDTNWHVFAIRYDGASSYMRVDTVPTLGNAGTNALTGLFIGATPTSLFLSGDIGEIAVVDSDLDLAGVAQFESYLNARWAVY